MSSAIVPIPQIDVSVREATLDDVAFIDELQKLHRNGVGFMHRGTLEGKIKAREVLIAERREDSPRRHGDTEACPNFDGASVSQRLRGEPLGYVIGTDRYFKHDDVGIIYHLNVAPGSQRGFVGATLLKAMFDRAAYGCKLFCCWCAQDIEANHFWEAMGFVPLAYRAGSAKKSRVHIFWQKRIRSGDTTTPWWFPSQTTGGAIREDRLVLPIPPGTHWSDAKPLILPGAATTDEPKKLEGPRPKRAKTPQVPTSRRLSFAPVAPPKPEKKPKQGGREKKPKRKNDPRLVAAARELKDRWLEHVNGAGGAGELRIESAGKYDVTRALPEAPAVKQLPMAA
jgi:hypothetical protein